MTGTEGPGGAHTYRASSGPVVLVLGGLLALYLLGDAVVRAGWVQMLLLAPWVLLTLWLVYELSASSSVRVDDDGVVVRNMLRKTSFGWSRIRDVDMRWQLEFSLEDGTTVTCYGGPARSRPRRTTDLDGDRTKVPGGLRELTEICDRWQAAPAGADAPIRRGWDVTALLVLGVIALWALGSVLVTTG